MHKTKSKLSVLLCVLKSPGDRDLLFEGSYRIPFAHAPGKIPRYLAFYQPSSFGSKGKIVELYAKVKEYAIKERREILPEEPDHPDSRKPYKEFKLGRINQLKHPIINRGKLRVSFAKVSLKKLKSSKTLHELLGIPPIEEILESLLIMSGIKFYRQYYVKYQKGRYFRLDFAVPSVKKWIDVECDTTKWHLRKEQIIKDKDRDKILKKLGWKILRVNEKLLLNHPNKILKKLKVIRGVPGQAGNLTVDQVGQPNG